ncbi:MAG: hypothetical protein Q4Q58_00180 [Thermoplasmata archaeon]|nr:hypothetical protein [Thermoplasmata archaeon]
MESISDPWTEQNPFSHDAQLPQHPGRYLPHPASGPVGLDSGTHTHMSPECMHSLHVLHLP